MAQVVGGSSLSTQVEISVACLNLADMDVMSKSDPICVLFVQNPGSNMFREKDRTEMIKDNLNPVFNKKFILDYYFEEQQKLQFKIYDIDANATRLDAHDFLGEIETTLGELVSRRKFQGKLQKCPKNANSTVIITCVEMQHSREVIKLSFEGRNLDRKDFMGLGKSDPFLEIYRPLHPITHESEIKPDDWTLVYRTEVIKKTLDPKWQQFQKNMVELCYGNKDVLLKLVCYDWNKRMKHSLIGICYTTVNKIVEAHSQSQLFSLMSNKNKLAGSIAVSRVFIDLEYTFIDYIQGGCDLNFTVGIDFTASNGDPRTPQSLHYFGSGQPNQYELAILSVGEIVQDYDSDRMFPCFGFGARVPPNHGTSHCFPLTLNPATPVCVGMQGLLSAYKSCLPRVELYGPTNFSPLINQVMEFATGDQSGKQYFVLLIITDGAITDFYETKRAVIKASKLPLSIIIIGVGDHDFGAMVELDSDDRQLTVGNEVAERDIVQFVPLKEFLNPNNIMSSKAVIAKEVLEELPGQVCQWMRMMGYKAGPPIERPVVNIPSAPYPTAPPPYSSGVNLDVHWQ